MPSKLPPSPTARQPSGSIFSVGDPDKETSDDQAPSATASPDLSDLSPYLDSPTSPRHSHSHPHSHSISHSHPYSHPPPDHDGGDDGSGGGTDGEKVVYRLYKRRWLGVVVIMLLNIVAGLCFAWFGPIADDTVAEFGFSLDAVDWLSTSGNLVFIALTPVVPAIYARLGVRRTCMIGGILCIFSSWVRFAGTASSLNTAGSYALIQIGQILAGAITPLFLVLIPGYSEKWFDLRGRTTATMLMSISNPIGTALGQLISPFASTPSQSLLILGIIYTVASPLVFLLQDAPPTPPTHSATKPTPSFVTFLRALAGRLPPPAPVRADSSEGERAAGAEPGNYMTRRERADFAIILLAFGVLVAVVNAFSILTSQVLEPYGYSDTEAGLMGATILLVGIVAACVTAPLFDRVFTHHLALTCKVLCPVVGAAWLSLVWAVRPDNTAALFVLMAVIGATSLTLLPVALELGVELTRNADVSSACLWMSSNLFTIVFVLVDDALTDGAAADPPDNMRRALIFGGAVVCAVAALVLLLEGRQTRRALDERLQREREGQRRGGEEGRAGTPRVHERGSRIEMSSPVLVWERESKSENEGKRAGEVVEIEVGGGVDGRTSGSVSGESDGHGR